MVITDLYKLLFGRKGMADGSVIDMSEHGRAGGISTGTPFKMIRRVEEKTAIDTPDSSTIYIGKAAQGSATSSAVWQIKKMVTSGTVILFTYADGNDFYDNVWDDRASLSYT